MALKLASSLHLLACAIKTALGVVQKPIFSQYIPVPRVNTSYACWQAAILGSYCADEALTYRTLPR